MRYLPPFLFLSLTCSQLEAYSNSVAMALHARGVQVEESVCVCMPRSTLWVATLLGVLRAGTFQLSCLALSRADVDVQVRRMCRWTLPMPRLACAS
jgi:acyl-coenzyme A synthetase/AMP-(fatty) acid ligase